MDATNLADERVPFGRRLRSLRGEVPLSDFAAQLGCISKTALIAYEVGERWPGVDLLIALHHHGIGDMDSLLGFTDVRETTMGVDEARLLAAYRASGPKVRAVFMSLEAAVDAETGHRTDSAIKGIKKMRDSQEMEIRADIADGKPLPGIQLVKPTKPKKEKKL